jgi:uncharacterized damage-inducible protein DinB
MLQTEATSPATSSSSLLKDYVTFNLWANRRLTDWLQSKPAELMEREVTSSFSSIKATLVHIWDVERSWFGHLVQKPVKSFRIEGFQGTLDDVFEGILNQSKQFSDYANRIGEAEMAAGCHFSILYVGEHTVPAFEIVHHCMNHSTYHRGQIVTIGRNLGLTDAPMTDYMYYLLREKSKQKDISNN